jgi:rhodanese-related sulfurtransferase
VVPLATRVVFAVALGALLGCASSEPSGEGGKPTDFQELDPAAARQLIEAQRGQDNFVILDVRTPREYQAERIAGSINIDFRSPTFRDEIARLDRGATYLLYCRTGNRSRQSLSAFRELGFRDVRHLTRGITVWKAEGHRVVSGG